MLHGSCLCSSNHFQTPSLCREVSQRCTSIGITIVVPFVLSYLGTCERPTNQRVEVFCYDKIAASITKLSLATDEIYSTHTSTIISNCEYDGILREMRNLLNYNLKLIKL